MEENLSNGKNDRLFEIVSAVSKEAEKLSINHPIEQLVFYMFFTEAALWIDDIPESVKSVESLFNRALSLFLYEKQNIYQKRKRQPILKVLMLLGSIRGAHWARNNPPKEIK